MAMADDPRKKKTGNNGGTTSQTEQASTLPSEVISEIRKQAVQQVAKTTIWAAVALVAIAGAGWVLYLKDKAPGWFGGVPKGAVLAFDIREGCPKDGWSPFENGVSRVIVGAVQTHGSPVLNTGDDGQLLTARPYSADGGQEKYALKPNQLPPKSITVEGLARAATNGDRYSAGGEPFPVITRVSGQVDVGGNGESISIMPPYIALYFCKKD